MKTDENVVVTQYQYHGWPTVEGEVPEVTRGLIELENQTLTNVTESSGSLVVHCSYGSDRSSMFVALSILVQQLRTEKRVDIFTTTKKLRSQRHGMISTFVRTLSFVRDNLPRVCKANVPINVFRRNTNFYTVLS